VFGGERFCFGWLWGWRCEEVYLVMRVLRDCLIGSWEVLKTEFLETAFPYGIWERGKLREYNLYMSNVRYLVSDVEKAIEFYTNLLGFTLVQKWGSTFAEAEKDGLSLWLSGPETSAARPMPDGRKPEPGGWNRIVIRVENLEETVNRMKKAGVTFRNDIVSGPGGKQVLAEDGVGNIVELFEERK
jgi:catechol 2,3-dioxygenase-like lactoylglutathione lyase family enzyme